MYVRWTQDLDHHFTIDALFERPNHGETFTTRESRRRFQSRAWEQTKFALGGVCVAFRTTDVKAHFQCVLTDRKPHPHCTSTAISCPGIPPTVRQIKSASGGTEAGGSVPFVVGGENPSARRVVTIFRLPDAGRAPLLIVERRAGGHCRGFLFFSPSHSSDGDLVQRAAGYAALKGADTRPLSVGCAARSTAEGGDGGQGGSDGWRSGYVISPPQIVVPKPGSVWHIEVMGMVALSTEPDHLAEPSITSRLLGLPNGSLFSSF